MPACVDVIDVAVLVPALQGVVTYRFGLLDGFRENSLALSVAVEGPEQRPATHHADTNTRMTPVLTPFSLCVQPTLSRTCHAGPWPS